MKSQCLPFSQIPHTTQLFSDFLAYTPGVRQFYPHSAHFGDWFKESASDLRYDGVRRAQVSSILERQNRSFEASPKTLENIARLRAGAAAVVTGQQVGLFGGPLFSIFKALTAVKLAAHATAGGVDCVPIFWLATQDHDLAEINHISLPAPDSSLHNIAIPTRGLPDAPVGSIIFGDEINSAVAAAAELLGDSEVTQFLRHSYRPGETFGSAFARLFARLFADWGVILLDAADPDLNLLAQPIYRNAIQHAGALNAKLMSRGKELESSGYHQQVKVTPASTLLFLLRDGSRIPIHQDNRNPAQPEFRAGDKPLSQRELLALADSQPQLFSANVLLRPILQDYLLPTLAYTGGTAEVAYFAQAEVVYQALAARPTPVVPRFSATLIDRKPQQLLERYGLTIPSVLRGPESLREALAARNLSPELHRSFDDAEAALEKSLARVRDNLAELDKTLLDSAAHAAEKMQYQLAQLRTRAARAELRQTEILGRHADYLSNSLYPNKVLQERELAGVSFVATHGLPLLREVYDSIRVDCLEHQAIALDVTAP